MDDTARPNFCPRCGHEAPAEGAYCSNCGADIVAESGGQDSDESGEVTRTFATCPECQADVPEGATECESCGADLTDSADVEDNSTHSHDEMWSTRRQAIVAGGAVLAAGAGGWLLLDDGGGLGGPEYGEGITKEDLLLSIDAFPDDWTRNDDFNTNFDAAYHNEDQSIVVLCEAYRHDTVEQAKNAMQSVREGTRDPREMSFGDEAFWGVRSDETAICFVRDSNVLGGMSALRESGFEIVPDETRAQTYAQDMYQHWQTL